MKLRLRKWDAFNHLSKKPCSLVLLIGKRGSGKSWMLRYLASIYQATKKIHVCIGFSPTDESNDVLSSFIPPTLIYSEFDEDVIERIMIEQRKRIRQKKPIRRVLLVFDDCGYDSKRLFKSNVIKSLVYNGRHIHITLILTLQYTMDMPSSIRGNIDVTLTLRETIQSNRERLYRYFFGQFDSMKSFSLALNACTDNYGCLVSANNLCLSTEISDSIFWFRAPADLPSVKLGDPALWKLDNRCYRDYLLEDDKHTTVEVRGVVAVEDGEEQREDEERGSTFS